MALQNTPRHKLLRILLVASILSIILFSVILYRSGSFQQIFTEYNDYNTNLPQGFIRTERIRSDHEIRNHIPLVRYHDRNEGPSEDMFRIAYLIFVHDPDTIKGAVMTLEQLFDDKHTFIIHLDGKASNYTLAFLYQSLAKFKSGNNPANPALFSLQPKNNLVVLQNHPINWGGFTMMQATFDMISAALQTGRWFDSVVLLSGSCHPVKPPWYIENKLKELRGKLFLTLDGTGGVDDKSKTEPRYDLYWVDYYYQDDKLPVRADEFDKVKKNYPADLQRSTGSQWATLSREFCEYVITSPWVKKLFIAHSTSYVPDESMFPLIANNSPFINNTFTKATDDIKFRYERWQKNQAHPAVLNERDALDIVKSAVLFARKLPPKPEVRSFFSRLAQQLWTEDKE